MLETLDSCYVVIHVRVSDVCVGQVPDYKEVNTFVVQGTIIWNLASTIVIILYPWLLNKSLFHGQWSFR